MRVGLMAAPWVPVPPTAYGGSEAIIDRLARGLVAGGHEVLLWTTGEATCPVPRGSVFERARGDRMGNDAIELRHLVGGYEAMVEWGADIVHDHTLIGPVYAHRLEDLAVVTTNHGPFDAELSALYGAIGDEVPVIAISHDQARRAGRIPIAAVIHHGLDLDRFPAGTGQGDELGSYFLFLGRMGPDKGAHRAAAAARRAGGRLLIAAKMQEPAEYDYFHEQVEPLLGPEVVYLGEVGFDAKVALLRGAAALINPIRWPEPFGLVMIEALACATPVVAFAEGSAPELVEHGATGFLCEDVTDLADHLARVGSLDRTRCREEAERRFSTERMVADHLDVYTRVLEAQAP